MPAPDTLLDEIAALLAGEGGDDVGRLERTLTDGYARALSLDAERRRLRQRIDALLARGGPKRERLALALRLEGHDRDLSFLREQLRRLQRRHSAAARGSRA